MVPSEPVPLPLVTVAMPPDATPNDSAVLIEACDRAYLAGKCEPSGDSNRDSELMGEVRWINETDAEVSLGLRRWRQNRWVRRQLRFQPLDASPERFRALGLVLGSLAGTVVEVTRLEAESRDSAAAPLPPAPDQATASLPSYRAWAGVTFGPGLEQLALGGRFGVGTLVQQRWALDLAGTLAAQGENRDRISARFASVSFTAGPQIALAPFSLALQGGPQLTWFSPRVAPLGDSDSSWKLGALLSLTLDVSELQFSPYLQAQGAYAGATDVEIDEQVRGTFGPLNFSGSAGIRWRLQ